MNAGTTPRESTAAGRGTPSHAALLEQLVAVVRPEFRADVVVPAADDPIMGSGLCLVPGCGRQRTTPQLCGGHLQRWYAAGTLTLEQWAPTVPALLSGRRVLPSCSAPGCNYGRGRRGLCGRHHNQWAAAGQPEAAAWLLTLPEVSTVQGERVCALPQCDLRVHGKQLYCSSHSARWRDQGQPALEDYIAHTRDYGEERFDFSRLPRQLRLELQHGLQCRVDSMRGRYRPRMLSAALRIAATLNVDSLLELTHDELRDRLAGVRGQHTMSRSSLPNGYCTLPLQKSCPTIDGCFSCSMFLTTSEFLPQHRDHAERTRRLIATAEANGQFRMVESNTRLLAKLDTVVAGLETPPVGDGPTGDDTGEQEATRDAS